MAKIAFLTVGVLHEPFGHPKVQGFFDRVPSVYEAAESSAGFVDRSQRDLSNFDHSWGDVTFDGVYGGEDPMRVASTLSLWEDLESVAAFAYHGAHGEAMAKRREWFVHDEHPTYIAWWVDDGHTPDWTEASEKLNHYAEHGATRVAFDFRSPFGHDGNERALDRDLVKRRIAENGP